MASNPPGAFAQQQRIIQSRFPPAAAAPSYDAWNDVWNDDQSESSWSTVTAEQGEGADQTSGHNKMDPIPEAGSFVPPTRDVPPPPATPNVWSQPQAPAMQAARNFVDHTNEPPASRRLRRQQENASRNGRRGVRYVQLGAHNAVNIELPNHVQQVGSKQGERSILVLDHRDQRLQSPFQGWLLDEILTNAAARINILSDSRLVRSPTTGYHCNLFLIKTLANVKVVFAGCMTSYESVTCGKWDSETAKVLSHPAFQPFRWPLMFNDSPTWVDVKVKLEGILLIHLELRGYRSDRDMTVQLNSVTDALLEILNENPFIPTFTVTIFQGWRVVSCSWEVGGRLYAASEGGVVVCLDYPLCHVELRVTATSSADAMGLDADRVEFRFLSASDRLDVSCSGCSVPPTWLVVSRVSGPTLIKNAEWCRKRYARIEGPDQTLQLSQLASVHAHWTAAIDASTEDETGPRISAVSVESHAQNLHLISESPLFRKGKMLVPTDALALQAHDPDHEQPAVSAPPITEGPAVQPTEAAVATRAILGVAPTSVNRALTSSDQDLSLTAPGVSPAPPTNETGILAPARRSLDQRRSEQLDQAAMTPAAFLDRVQSIPRRQPANTSNPPPIVEEVLLEYHDAVEGSGVVSTSSAPVSYGPKAR